MPIPDRRPCPAGPRAALHRLGIVLACACALAAPPSAASAAEAVTLADLIAELRAANYATDAAATERLRDRFRALAADPAAADRALAYYQAATASGLLAAFVSPGAANPQGDPEAAARHMEEAAADLERAAALDPGSADVQAALANNYGIRVAGAQADREQMMALATKARDARRRSLELGPRNPRVVAGHAGALFWAPPQGGGDPPRGLARYREALELFAAEPAAERDRHAWGEPDTWAFLALAEMSRAEPDLAAARSALDRALALRPDFTWARAALLPQLELAERQAKAAPAPPASGASGTNGRQ